MLATKVQLTRTSRCSSAKGTTSTRARLLCRSCQRSQGSSEPAVGVQASRRRVLLSGLALVGGAAGAQNLGAVPPAVASEASGSTSSAAPDTTPNSTTTTATVRYDDPADNFSISVPSGWVSGEGALEGSLTGFGGVNGSRRAIAWFPADVPAKDVNVSVVITNVSVEFTKLGSFGNVATFATNLVNSLDRSFLLRTPSWSKKPTEPVQVASLVDYKESRGKYFVEYTVQKLPEPQRHLLSAVALGSNGRYNRLYTVTAQCTEDALPQYRSTLEDIVNSFTANVKPLA